MKIRGIGTIKFRQESRMHNIPKIGLVGNKTGISSKIMPVARVRMNDNIVKCKKFVMVVNVEACRSTSTHAYLDYTKR